MNSGISKELLPANLSNKKMMIQKISKLITISFILRVKISLILLIIVYSQYAKIIV
jgi:hypothetical protein